jgi:hypothetical protein
MHANSRKALIRIFAVVLTIGASSATAGALIWGACGHPQKGGLWSDPETQLATLEQRGLSTYRFDVNLTTNHPEAADELRNLIGLARKHHITLHPILYVPFTWGDATDGGKYPSTDEGLEAQGYDRVYPFVLQFANQIRDWEMQNELSLRKGLKSGIGRSADDYATPLARQWAAVLRGMSHAIRDISMKTREPLRTVVDIVYVDFGFVPFLESQGVSVDKLAYHYYYALETTPYKIYAPNGTVDLFAQLQKTGKPIIINEFNAAEITAPGNGKPYDDAKALASLKKHIGYIIGQTEANIEGVEYYELYNEPSKDAVESNFGLMKDPATARTQMLLAGAYACGDVRPNEQMTLVSSGLFTEGELSQLLARCQVRSAERVDSFERR